jgi:hypothetical protein
LILLFKSSMTSRLVMENYAYPMTSLKKIM